MSVDQLIIELMLVLTALGPIFPMLFWTGSCCSTCDICSDDFNRSDSTDIDTGSSCGWTEESGSWAIASNALSCTSAGNAICTATHPSSHAMVVSVSASHNTANSSVCVIFCRKDASNYCYAKYNVNGAIGYVELHRVSGGSDGLLTCKTTTTLSTSTAYTLKVCVNDAGETTAFVDGSPVVSSPAQQFSSTHNGAGLKALGSGTATFDSFVFSKHEGAGSSNCEDCATGTGASCTVCSDNFNRSDSTDITTGSSCCWIESIGSWEIASNKLKGGGTVLTGIGHPDGYRKVIVESVIRRSVTGSGIHGDVLVGVLDTSNLIRVRYTFNGASGSVNIISVSGAVSTTYCTLTVTLNSATDYTAKVCVDEDGTVTAFLDGTAKVSAHSLSIPGAGAGLAASGGSGDAEFDSFSFEKYYDQDDGLSCDTCTEASPPVRCVNCCADALTLTVARVVVSGFVDDTCTGCTELNGTYLCDLVEQFSFVYGGNGPKNGHRMYRCTWQYVGAITPFACPHPITDFDNAVVVVVVWWDSDDDETAFTVSVAADSGGSSDKYWFARNVQLFSSGWDNGTYDELGQLTCNSGPWALDYYDQGAYCDPIAAQLELSFES